MFRIEEVPDMQLSESELEALQRKIYREIREFPERIDEMETRSEEACRRLAGRIVDLLRQRSTEPRPDIPL